MAFTKKISLQKFPAFTIAEYSIDPFQTTNNTQQTIASFPVKQNQYVSVLSYEASGHVSDFSDNVEADLQAAFLRQSGNVSRTSNNVTNGLIRNIFTSVGLLNTISIDAVANTSTNQIDFKVTGQTSKTINWNFMFRIKFSN